MGITNRLTGWIVDSADRIRQNKASNDLIRRSKNYESKVQRKNETNFAKKHNLRRDRNVPGRMWLDNERYVDADFCDPVSMQGASAVINKSRSKPTPVIKKVSKKDLEKMRKVSPGVASKIFDGATRVGGNIANSPGVYEGFLLGGEQPTPKKKTAAKKKTKKRSTTKSQSSRSLWDDLI